MELNLEAWCERLLESNFEVILIYPFGLERD